MEFLLLAVFIFTVLYLADLVSSSANKSADDDYPVFYSEELADAYSNTTLNYKKEN